MENIRQMIGARIRSLRQAKGYSIEELALLSGLNPSHLGKIERIERNFTIDTLNKIILALNVSPGDFFCFDSPANVQEDPLIDKTMSCLKVLNANDQKAVYEIAAHFLMRKEDS
ncbi:MAG: helix-turn-helix transcriptional regulator [Bacillota bacterium]|nr:helix-turn-helix transcriptional regulator [Bacillota bacterium]